MPVLSGCCLATSRRKVVWTDKKIEMVSSAATDGDSLSADKKPANLYTVFAGMETDAVAKAREYFMPYPPSSPAMAIFKDGKLVHFIERHHIEGRSADMIATHLTEAYKEFC